SSVFLYSSRHPHDLHSFPTRRSSDLASISQRQCFAINAWSTCRFASKQVVIAGITPFQFIGFLALLHIALARCWGRFRDSEVLLGRSVAGQNPASSPTGILSPGRTLYPDTVPSRCESEVLRLAMTGVDS